MMFGNHDLHPFPATHVELGKPLVLPSPPLNREAERQRHRCCQPQATCPGKGGNDYLEEIQKVRSVELDSEG